MKKILLVLSLLGLFGGWIEKSNEKEKLKYLQLILKKLKYIIIGEVISIN